MPNHNPHHRAARPRTPNLFNPKLEQAYTLPVICMIDFQKEALYPRIKAAVERVEEAISKNDISVGKRIAEVAHLFDETEFWVASSDNRARVLEATDTNSTMVARDKLWISSDLPSPNQLHIKANETKAAAKGTPLRDLLKW